MSSRINHVAITSDHYAMNARFYEALFGMKTGKKALQSASAGQTINWSAAMTVSRMQPLNLPPEAVKVPGASPAAPRA